MGIFPFFGDPCGPCGGTSWDCCYVNANEGTGREPSMYLYATCRGCGGEGMHVAYELDGFRAACGWAFDCGVREGHIERLRNTLRLMEVVGKQTVEFAVLEERARCVAEMQTLWEDEQCLLHAGRQPCPPGMECAFCTSFNRVKSPPTKG